MDEQERGGVTTPAEAGVNARGQSITLALYSDPTVADPTVDTRCTINGIVMRDPEYFGYSVINRQGLGKSV